MIAYLDTSAAMKLLVEEPESSALTAFLQAVGDGQVAAGWLLHTELHCAARRHPDVVEVAAVGALLDAVTLVDITRGTCSPPVRCRGACAHTTRSISPWRCALALMC